MQTLSVHTRSFANICCMKYRLNDLLHPMPYDWMFDLPCSERHIEFTYERFLEVYREDLREVYRRSCTCYPSFDQVSIGGDVQRTRTQFPYYKPIHIKQDFQAHRFNISLPCAGKAFLRGSRVDSNQVLISSDISILSFYLWATVCHEWWY